MRAPQVSGTSVEGFFFQTAREWISILERTGGASRSSTQLQQHPSAWLRPTRTVSNASRPPASSAPGESWSGSSLSATVGAAECNPDPHLGDRAPVPPAPSSPRKFLESANSYLTQKVIAQLLGDGRGCFRPPGDLRRPFIDKLPLRFYTVHCTPSAKESESSALQTPGSLLHASHSLTLTRGEGGRQKEAIQEKSPLPRPSPSSGSESLLAPCGSAKSWAAREPRPGGGECSVKRLGLPVEWSPSPSQPEWK